jgi:hypothetical protein
VGQAIAHTQANNLTQASRAVGRAFGMFVHSGLTPAQAAQRIKAIVDTFKDLQ